MRSWEYASSLPFPDTYYARGVKARSTIHGDLHGYRVSILCSSLHRKGLDNEGCVAGLYHDIGCVNDKKDERHGERSAKILRDVALFDWSGLSKKSILDAIFYHEKDIDSNKKQEPILSALKVADALDRYRLPKTKWWPNVDYMNIVPEEYVFKIAYCLVVYSERLYLKSHDAKASIDEALTVIEKKCKK